MRVLRRAAARMMNQDALEKLREEMEDLAEVLEEVHLASENADPETVKSKGRDYLETSRQVIR